MRTKLDEHETSEDCQWRYARSKVGIAASDAACCARLGRYSRSQNHRDAAKLLAGIEPGGQDASKDFELLIGKKDEANYGFNISITELKTLLRKAEGLMTFAHKSINF